MRWMRRAALRPAGAPRCDAAQRLRRPRAWRRPGAPSRARPLAGPPARPPRPAPQVATIYDVLVHPEVRGQGVGRRLMQLLVQQLQMQDIYDVGLVTLPEAQGFFRGCAFEPDREGSTPMSFTAPTEALVHTERLRSSEALRALLRRALLRRKLGELG
jgi:GNAT superfamily N-acetyltransferase